MKTIGIDAHAAERDGTGNCTYVRGLIGGLINVDRHNEYILYVTNPDHPFYKTLEDVDNFSLRVLKPRSPLIRIPLSLAKQTFSDALDLLHVQYIAPFAHRGKLVVTIHDLAFSRVPQSFSVFERFRSRILVPLNAKKADTIITGSDYTKMDIVNLYKVDPGKIVVTPYGVSSLFRPITRSEKFERILKKYGILNKYIFSLSRINLRKNLSQLIKAFEKLREHEPMKFNLVLGGHKDFLAEKVIREINNSKYAEDIIFTGYVLEEDLPYLYSAAEVFVYPSVFEGFGFPPLEAMACGCPVITSDVTSLPEVVAEAALLVNPGNEEEISRAVSQVMMNAPLRKDLKERGLQRAKGFNWENTAKKTLEVYERSSAQR